MRWKRILVILPLILGLAGCTKEEGLGSHIAWLNIGMQDEAVSSMLGEPQEKTETEWKYTLPYAGQQVEVTITLRQESALKLLAGVVVSYQGTGKRCAALFERMDKDWMSDVDQEDKERYDHKQNDYEMKVVQTKDQAHVRQLGSRIDGDTGSVVYRRDFTVETDFNPYYAPCLLYQADKGTLTQDRVELLMGQGAGQSQQIAVGEEQPRQAYVYDDVIYLGQHMRMALFYRQGKEDVVLERIVLFYEGDAQQATTLYNDAVAQWEKEKENMDIRQTMLDDDMLSQDDAALAQGALGQGFQRARTSWSNTSKSGDTSKLARRSVSVCPGGNGYTVALSFKPFIESKYW